MSELTFMEAPFSKSGLHNKKKSDFAILGLPSDLGADTNSGQMTGSQHIRAYSELLDGFYLPLIDKWCEHKNIVDCGDLIPEERNIATYNNQIIQAVYSISKNTKCLIALGGDDSVSYGIAKGLKQRYSGLAMVHFDAHVDRYDEATKPINHSNWVEKLVKTTKIPIMQIGCRAPTNYEPLMGYIRNRPKFISIDMDVVDPSFAPGVSCPVPLGMNPIDLIHEILTIREIEDGNIVGVAINEVSSHSDIDNQTSRLVNSILQHIIYA